jgi:hypothetical protein
VAVKSVGPIEDIFRIEAGAPVTHHYLIGKRRHVDAVRPADGQTIELATIGRDNVVGVSAVFGDAIATSEASVLVSGSAVTVELASDRAGRRASDAAGARAGCSIHSTCATIRPAVDRSFRHGRSAFNTIRFRSLPLNLMQAGIRYNRGHIDIDDPESLEATSCQCHVLSTPLKRTCGDTVTCDYISCGALAR